MENYSPLLKKQRDFFTTEQTKKLSFRLDALNKLRNAIKSHESEFLQGLKEDLNKSEFDAYSTEIGIVLEEIRFAIKNIHQWSQPRKVKTPVTHFGARSYIYPEPYGVALIISPWNYPFQLAVAPLIGAIAAGNCAVLKPSELTPKTSEILAKVIREIFPEEYVSVARGGVETSQALLKEYFDYIFFTGSVSVGKVVMEAASKHLTPVTLELGGKSPCIVHKDANLKIAAKRIAWGKFINAGQTCIAPDYLYIHKEIKDQLLHELRNTIIEFYGEEPAKNNSYTKIVSERHFQRLEAFLNNGTVFTGGRTDAANLKIEPTILTNVTWNDPIMEEEIFGPILPVLEFEDIPDIVQQVNSHPKPLALYIFSESKEVQDLMLNRISFGGGCINDTVYHISTPYLPFGGVGNSGSGSYHGKGSFDTFSHEKSILKQTTKFDIPVRYPNFKNGLKIIKKVFK